MTVVPTARVVVRHRAATPFLITSIVAAVLGLVSTVIAWPHLDAADAYPAIALSIAAAIYAILGWLIVRRAANPIGWLLLVEGLLDALMLVTSMYGVIGVADPGSVPSPEAVGTVSESLFVPVVMLLAVVLLLFPNGALPSPRWRAVAGAIVAATASSFAAFLVTPRTVALPVPGGVSVTYPNPFAIEALRGTVLGTLIGLGVVSLLALTAGVIAIALRFRSGDADRREQIKWVAFIGSAFVVMQGALAVAQASSGNAAGLVIAIGLLSAVLGLFGFPAAITIAILRHRLYDIDLIINRTVVYGLVAAAITAVYVTIVAGAGAVVGSRGGPVLTIVAAVAIAVSFEPLLRRARAVANRLVYGERATPYEVLGRFADLMAQAVPVEEQLDRMVSLLANGIGAARVEVSMRVGEGSRTVATWPPDAPAGGHLDDERSAIRVPVRQGDEELGMVGVVKPPNEPLTPPEEALLDHVASQAGVLLRNVGLTSELRLTIDELRASRRRLVAAQDSERRRIERNIHDGAQQRLVALGVKLGLAKRSVGRDERRLEGLLEELQRETAEALDELRELARGIYPPLLADRGLVAAVEAVARRAPLPVRIEADGDARYPTETEAAVYFCVLEALQNVAKYADASQAIVSLRMADDELRFEVLDDGSGFDPSDTRYGTGLQGMADRLGALGGSLHVQSSPGSGTRAIGVVPLGRPSRDG